MRKWLRQVLGRTKLERIEALQREVAAQVHELNARQEAARATTERDLAALSAALRESNRDVAHLLQGTSAQIVEQLGAAGSQRVAALAKELVLLERRLLLTIHEHRQEMAALNAKVEALQQALVDREQLAQRLRDEATRARELADQTAHLLSELGMERAAAADLRGRATAAADLQAKLDTTTHALDAAAGERDALRDNVATLEAACAAVMRSREAVQAELQRVTRQRDDLLRGDRVGAGS